MLWLVAGAGSAVEVGVEGRRAAQRPTPEDVADQVGAARLGLAGDYPQHPLAGTARASEATGARPRLVAAADPSPHS